jgi:hypothetical protein
MVVPGIPSPNVPESSLRVVWVAHVAAVPIYGVVGWLAGGRGPVPGLTTLGYVFAGLALLLVLFSSRMRSALAPRMTYTAWLVTQWAVQEAVAILGLVLRMLGASWGMAGIFFAVSFFMLLGARPSEGRRAEYERLRGGVVS